MKVKRIEVLVFMKESDTPSVFDWAIEDIFVDLADLTQAQQETTLHYVGLLYQYVHGKSKPISEGQKFLAENIFDHE
jgi:hypothetical protein